MIRLEPRAVAKPWGRSDLGPGFESFVRDEPIGEVWFEALRPTPLLVKYLFTSERLSIQVHPDDGAARGLGLPHGKDEAWIILDAEPGAEIGLGLRTSMTRKQVKDAALSGSLEQMVEWRPVKKGDAIYSPGGTVHALGAGLKLVEVQQSLDLTLRLYDYGRPRPIQVDQALDVARLEPFPPSSPSDGAAGPGREVLVGGPRLRIERATGPLTLEVECAMERPAWLIPLSDDIRTDEHQLSDGEVWMLETDAAIFLGPGAVLLTAFPA